MYQTTYHRAKSLAEAKTLFSGSGDAAYISGGHTLLPAMKARLAAPAHLIDLRHIPELRGIEVSGDSVSIGDAQVRHLGTIGGSVANNDPAADYPAAVLALAGTVHTDKRQIQADQYFTGLYTTAREEGEIVTRVSFRIPETSGYAKFRNPASRYPMAGVFVARHRDGTVRVAVTGAGNDGVFRWSEAEQALSRSFAAEALQGLTVPVGNMMGDIHGSPEYRANLVAV